jgi:hypothetical protein
MSKKVLTKKIIVTTNFSHLSEAALGTTFSKLQNGGATNSPAGLVLSPTPAAVLTQINARNGLFTTRSGLQAQLKQNTEDIGKADTALKTLFTDQWATQIQNFGGITVNQVKGLGFGSKGIDTGHAATSVADTARTASSAPVIIKIDTDVHGQHTLHIHNNITGKIGHPKDVLRIDLYAQNGGTAPANLAALIANGGGWLGTAKRGKYINPFIVTATNKNTVEYYIAVYIEKATKKPAAQSNVENAVIE